MSRQEAKKMAMRLSGEGKSYSDIAEILAAQGVVSSRTGQKFTVGGVARLIRGNGRKRKSLVTTKTMAPARPTAQRPVKREGGGVRDLVRSIIRLDAPATERLALIDLALGI